jgi:hypothetical protein
VIASRQVNGFDGLAGGGGVRLIYDDRGHLPVKDQEAAVAFYPEVADVVEQKADRLAF